MALSWIALAFADHGVLEVDVTEVVRSDDGSLLAIVSVLDHGRPLTGLDIGNFSAADNGQAIPVSRMDSSEVATIPLSVVVTLDTSGSMEGAAMSASLAAAAEFVENLRPGDPTALINFADTVVVQSEFANDRAAILGSIASLEAVGNTALYEAVARSAELAANAGTTRKAVLLLSDGEDFGDLSVATREQSLAAARDSGAVFYAIGVGDSIDVEYLTELATSSGGRYFAAPEPGDIGDIYRSLSERLRGQYILTLEPLADAPGGHTVTISVQSGGASGEASSGYNITAEPTATAPAEPTSEPTAVPPSPTPTIAPSIVGITEDEPSEGGGLPVATFGILGVVLAAAGGALLYTRRRASAGEPEEEVAGDAKEAAPTRPAHAAEAPVFRGELSIERSGAPSARALITMRPMTLGSAADSDVVLTGQGVGAHHLRLWWRDGRLMLHHLDRSRRTLVNGQPAEWVALEPGDRIALGDYELSFVGSNGAHGTGSPAEASPNGPVA